MFSFFYKISQNFLLKALFKCLKDYKAIFFLFSSQLILNLIAWLIWHFKLNLQLYPVYSPFSFFSPLLIPTIGTFILFLNSLFFLFSYKKSELIAYFLLGNSIFVQILILILAGFYLIKF